MGNPCRVCPYNFFSLKKYPYQKNMMGTYVTHYCYLNFKLYVVNKQQIYPTICPYKKLKKI